EAAGGLQPDRLDDLVVPEDVGARMVLLEDQPLGEADRLRDLVVVLRRDVDAGLLRELLEDAGGMLLVERAVDDDLALLRRAAARLQQRRDAEREHGRAEEAHDAMATVHSRSPRAGRCELHRSPPPRGRRWPGPKPPGPLSRS